MSTLITGLAMFALGLGAVVLILIWHNSRVQSIRQQFKDDRAMWKARNKSL